MKLPENIVEIDNYKRKITATEQLKYNSSLLTQTIKQKAPIVTYKSEPVFFERTINMIQGSYGTHKSRLAGHIASVLIGKVEILGMRASKQFNILYCDTERDTEDELPINMKNILKLSEDEENKKYLRFFSFYDIERNERMDELRKLVEEVKKQINDEHLIIFIDVASDFVNDFNKLSESNQFIDFCSRLIKNLDCTLFLIIHENPGKDNNKARGHIGTELGNKSNTVLSIGSESETSYKIKMLKQRRAKRLNNIYVQYSDSFDGLILADRKDISENGYKVTIEEFTAYIIEMMKKGENYWQQDIIKKCASNFNVTERTVINKFKELRNKPTLLPDYNLKLLKGKNNRNYFKLISNEDMLPI